MRIHLHTPRNTIQIIRSILPLSLLLLCMACGNNQGTTTNTPADTAGSLPDTPGVKEAVYSDDSTDNVQFVPKDIKSAGMGAVKTIPGKTFDTTLALRALFPGNYYRYSRYGDSASIEELVSWRCKDCPPAGFKGWEGEYDAAFPNEEGNMTMCTDTLMYIGDDGKRNVLAAFSTMPVQSLEFMHTGRFCCSILGLALFTAGDDNWELKSFAPALGCYGAFQSMPDIHLLRLGNNNYGCYLLSTNGGAGGPFYSDIYAFGMIDGKFKKIMDDAGVERFHSGASEWQAVLSSVKTKQNGFEDLALTMSGIYSKYQFEDDTTSNLPRELQPFIKTKDSINFTITRQYHFNGSSYTPQGSSINAK